ncbi:hypothetical protein FAI40_08975 [Acetobacteraceae bacterium]|nr:hypothetical protein FAI40_08975 [Acetobacteraceae bacterium]
MQNLKGMQELKEREDNFLSPDFLASLSFLELQSALDIQIGWGISDIFDDAPGLSSEKLQTSKDTHLLSIFNLQRPSPFHEARRDRFVPKKEEMSVAERAKSFFKNSTPVQKPRPSSVPAVSMEEFLKNLQKTQTVEEALQCAKEAGSAGLSQMALQDIRGFVREKGGGFVVSAESSPEVERAGKIFVGEEGKLTRRFFRSIGLSLEDLSAAPVLPWRPPGGRDPLPEEVAICRPLLRHIIALNSPKWVVTFGALAAKMLLENEEAANSVQSIKERYLRPSFRLAHVKGKWHEVSLGYEGKKTKVFPLNAPARLKKNVRMRQAMWRDLQVFKRDFELL